MRKRAVVAGVFILLMGLVKVLFSGAGLNAFVFEVTGDEGEQARLGYCDSVLGLLGIQTHDRAHDAEELDPELAQLEAQAIKAKCDAMLPRIESLHDRLLPLVFAENSSNLLLGFFTLFIAASVLRQRGRLGPYIRIAFFWQLLQVVINLVYSCLYVRENSEIHNEFLRSLGNERIPWFLVNSFALLEPVFPVLACGIYWALMRIDWER